MPEPLIAQNVSGIIEHMPQTIAALIALITGAAAMSRVTPYFIENMLVKHYQAAYFKAYRNRINRQGLPLKGRYGAAGPDLSSVLYIFDPAEVEFIDKHGYNITRLQQLIDEWDDEILNNHFTFRYKEGYWPKQLTQFHMEELILAELQALGVEKSDVMPLKATGNGDVVLSFWWPYPGENKRRLRTFVLKKGDITETAVYAPADFYFQKASMEVNEKIKEFINDIAKSSNVVLISPFTTNGISQLIFQVAWAGVTADWESGKNGFVLEQRFTSINKKFRQRLASAFENQYCWKLELWQKKSEDKEPGGEGKIFKSLQTGSIGRAILPENIERVNRWVNEGKSAFNISVRVALPEFFASLNFPKFIAAHPAGSRAARTVARAAKWGGIIAFVLGPLQGLIFGDMDIFKPLAEWFVMGNYVIGDIIIKKALEFIIGAFAVSVPVHVYLDYHYLKASGLHKAIRDFGAAKLDENGRVHTNVYIVDSLPEDMQGAGQWENAGQVDGKPVYESVDPGALVLFADAVAPSRVAVRLNETIASRGAIAGSRRVRSKFKASFKTLGIDIKSGDMKPGIIVDHGLDGERIIYNPDGSMTVGPQMFNMAGELIAVKSGEAFAMSRNVFINMDEVENMSRFMERLDAFIAAGNGQMVVNPAVFGRLTDGQRNDLLRLANANKVRIFVDLENDVSKKEEYRRQGFAGYAAETHGVMRIHDFAFCPQGKEGRILSGFAGAQQLREKMAAAVDVNIILNESELRALLAGAERSIEERMALCRFLQTTVLGLYKPQILSEDYVAAVAYGRSKADIPPMPQNIELALKAFDTGTPEDIVTALGSPRLGVYVKKIAADLEDVRQRQRAATLQKAYLAAIFERMLLNDFIKRDNAQVYAGYENGTYAFTDPRYEKMLGALLAKAARMDASLPGRSAASAFSLADAGNYADTLLKNYDEVIAAAAPAPESVAAVIDALVTDIYEDYRLKQLGAGLKPRAFTPRSIEQTLSSG